MRIVAARSSSATSSSIAPANVVADRAHLVERQALRVGQLPVDVALARDVGARVAAAHRDHDVGPLGVGARRAGAGCVGQVDAELPHRLDHLGVDVLAGIAAGGARLVPATGAS